MFGKKEFWNGRHKENNMYWLTNSDIGSMCHFHKFNLPSGKDVLEVGVGTGSVTRSFYANNNRVVAVDISEEALKRVYSFTETFLTENMADIPANSIDFALSHLVFQHCEDDMIEFIIKETVRALRPAGIFSFQFADIGNEAFIDPFHKKAMEDGYLIFRSEERVQEIVANCGATIISKVPNLYWVQENGASKSCESTVDRIKDNEFYISWHIYRVGKKEYI